MVGKRLQVLILQDAQVKLLSKKIKNNLLQKYDIDSAEETSMYPKDMIDLEWHKFILEIFRHFTQVSHILVFGFPNTLNL